MDFNEQVSYLGFLTKDDVPISVYSVSCADLSDTRNMSRIMDNYISRRGEIERAVLLTCDNLASVLFEKLTVEDARYSMDVKCVPCIERALGVYDSGWCDECDGL